MAVIQTSEIAAFGHRRRRMFISHSYNMKNLILCCLKFVVSVERLTEIGGLRTDEEIVFANDLVFCQLTVAVSVRFLKQMFRLGFRVIEIRWDYPLFNLSNHTNKCRMRSSLPVKPNRKVSTSSVSIWPSLFLSR